MSDNPVTTMMVHESFIYAQLSVTEQDPTTIGSKFTVAKSKAFYAWLESVKLEAYNEGLAVNY